MDSQEVFSAKPPLKRNVKFMGPGKWRSVWLPCSTPFEGSFPRSVLAKAPKGITSQQSDSACVSCRYWYCKNSCITRSKMRSVINPTQPPQGKLSLLDMRITCQQPAARLTQFVANWSNGQSSPRHHKLPYTL